MSRSPLRWFGAKTQLAPVIAGLFVPHRCSVELFAGSAAVTLAKTRAEAVAEARAEYLSGCRTDGYLKVFLGGVDAAGEPSWDEVTIPRRG